MVVYTQAISGGDWIWYCISVETLQVARLDCSTPMSARRSSMRMALLTLMREAYRKLYARMICNEHSLRRP